MDYRTMTNLIRLKRQTSHRSRSGRGFTLLEVMIAILVLTVGVLGLASTMTECIAYMQASQDDFIAQQKAEQGLESVFFARDSKLYQWDQIKNVSNGGIFLDGPQPLLHAGPNGIVGTAQDDATNPDVILEPGPDGVLGTPDDVRLPLTNFTRQIILTDIPGEPGLRQIQVIVQYQSARFQRQYTLTSYVSRYT